MDYDQTEIAESYDQARARAPETARLWLDLLSVYVDRRTMPLIVDLGCGTGRFSNLLAARFAGRVIGIDPSNKMISQARRKPAAGNVTYRQGPAEAIPVDDACADLVFMSQIYHHLDDPAAAASECRRVLRRDGVVCVRNGTRQLNFPQRPFFPQLEPLIESQLPSREDIERVFIDARFSAISRDVVTQVVAFVEKSAFRADSFLARLSDRDFEDGMAAMRSPGAAIDPDAPVTEEIDWFVFGRS